MKNLKVFTLAVLLNSCGSDDSADSSQAAFDACGNPTSETVNDKRCLYTVSTLTQSFDGSGGLVVGDDGFVYVANFGDNLSNANGKKVSRVDPTSGEVTIFANGLNGASGNTFATDGKLFQANIRGQSISEISTDGQVSLFSNAGLASPVGVAFDQAGNLYVCNCGGGGSIQKIEPDGTSARFSTSALLNCPNGLTIDDSGNLYAANFNNSDVIKISADGTTEQLVTLPGSSNAHLAFGNGVLYVLSRSGNRLYEVTLDGQVSVIAGTGSSGNTDGSGETATFSIPNGIDVSPDGKKIYVTSKVPGQDTQLNPVLVRVVELK